jgi:hypothetical protein
MNFFMSTNMKKNSLASLSNPELFKKIHYLAERERELTLEVITHLREIFRRRAYAERGYGSLWKYVTSELKYSSGAAKRRIDAMHALGENPELESEISSGALSLSASSQVQSFVRHQRVPKSERLDLFQSMSGKSTREVEQVLRILAPEAPLPERVRVMSEALVELKFSIPLELHEKLKRLQGMCAHRLKDATSIAELLGVLAELGLRELDPGKEPGKRGKASAANSIAPPTAALESSAPNSSPRTTPDPSKRYIPLALRRAVWRNASGRCTYVDEKTGRACRSRFALQVEHIQPFAKGGSSTKLDNLTLLCRQHNLLRAVQEFGAIPREREARS